jgi:hypothetical protein
MAIVMENWRSPLVSIPPSGLAPIDVNINGQDRPQGATLASVFLCSALLANDGAYLEPNRGQSEVMAAFFARASAGAVGAGPSAVGLLRAIFGMPSTHGATACAKILRKTR